MILIHPKRFFRKYILWYDAFVFRVQCRIHHVRCEIGKNTCIRHCSVKSKRDGIIIIGSGCTLHGVTFGFYGSGGKIEISDSVFINAYRNHSVSLFVNNKSLIMIGSHCLFSNSIEISTTDWHRIYDESGIHLNPDKNVCIGDRVWIGRKVIICKGVSIPDNSVIGVGSIVTKSFYEPNVVIAGNPAVVKKRGIHW